MAISKDEGSQSLSSVYNLHPPKINIPSTGWAIPDNFIGVEHEVEGVTISNAVNASVKDMVGWAVVEDHSLRNGSEFVTNGPLVGTGLDDALRSFEEWFNSQGRARASFRTSTHVHIDFSQKRDTLKVIQDFFATYYILEDAFYGVADVGRQFNGYCMAFEKADYDLESILLARNASEFNRAVSNSGRYYGCNPLALRAHGTIEFRHMPLTPDVSRLSFWINCILRMKKFVLDCADISEQNIAQTIDDVGVEHLAKTVFEEFYSSDKPEFNVRTLNKKLDTIALMLEQKVPKGNGCTEEEYSSYAKNPLLVKAEAAAVKPAAKTRKQRPPAAQLGGQATLTTVDDFINILGPDNTPPAMWATATVPAIGDIPGMYGTRTAVAPELRVPVPRPTLTQPPLTMMDDPNEWDDDGPGPEEI